MLSAERKELPLDGHDYFLARFELDPTMPDSTSQSLHDSVELWSWAGVDLITLDISRGEPAWLATELQRLGRFRAALELVPAPAPASPLKEAWDATRRPTPSGLRWYA
ncbi:hypothetical protein OL229_01105 [Neisseriaceae bacterium JH1-16]|nr:hypothetical protein [Neisseriaceae bacterium JH1-16]